MTATGNISFLFVCLGQIESSLKQAADDLDGNARECVDAACICIKFAKESLLAALAEETNKEEAHE